MSNPTYRRTQPFAAYLLLLMLSIGGYYLYSLLVVPQIIVSDIGKRARVDTSQRLPEESDIAHRVWFPKDGWEQKPCAVLLTAQGKILFDDFRNTDPKTWIVEPFSMVLNRKEDPSNPGTVLPPIILRCEKGATLNLDQPISTFGKSNVQLNSAHLEGDVELYRHTAKGSQHEDFRIETSNVQIDRSTVTAIADVAFWFGNNQGIGRQMTLSLAHDDRAGNGDFSDISGINGLRLGLLSTMQLNPTRNSSTAKNSDRMFSTDGSPIQINTNGPFEFDFSNNIARFSTQIEIRKMDETGDNLTCNELLLKFKSDGQQMVKIDAAADNEYELQSIVAKGSPVILNAHSQNAQVNSEILRYNLQTQIVQATATSDGQQISIDRGDTQFVAKSIQYQLTEDKKLGQLSAAGPGQIFKNDPENPFRASWAKSLQIRRINEQQHLIQMQGKSRLNLGTDTQLNSNRINLTVWEVPTFDANGKFANWAYQPAELSAKKRVHIASDKLIADASELIATWPANPRKILRKAAPNILGNLAPAPRSSIASINSNPFQPNMVRRVSYEFAQQPINPLTATGNLIRVTVHDQNEKTQINELQILGGVVVKKPSDEQPGETEFTVTGDSLKMTPQDDKRYRVQVTGSDRFAQILSDRFQMSGEEVLLDQTDNSMWIKGHGNVQLNGDALAKNQSDTDPANRMLPSSRLDIGFAGGMIFDGQNIYFEQGVVADIKQYDREGTSLTKATGNALKIILDQKVQFDKLNNSNNRTNPQILEMIFLNTLPPGKAQFQLASFANSDSDQLVTVENVKTDLTGKVTEKFKLNSPNVVMSKINDRLQASGPGGIEIYRTGSSGLSSQRGGLGFVGERSKPGDNTSITYIHTHFDRQMTTGIESKNLSITGNVRAIYAPVNNFQASYSPTQSAVTPSGTVRLYCNQMDLVQSNNPLSPQPNSQFTATGNAHIEADRFASHGDRISYRDDTDNLVIESLTGQNVELRMRNNAQAKFNKEGIVGSRLIYNLRTKSAEAQNVDSLSAPINKRP